MTQFIRQTQSATKSIGVILLDFLVKKISGGSPMASRYW